MVTKKSWEELRNAGLLWWINQLLHTFGWAIVYDLKDDGTISEVYPARVKFRGFGEKQITEGYQKISQYMKDNINELLKEASE